MLSVASFFNLTGFSHPELFADCRYAWDALGNLKAYMADQAYPNLTGGPIIKPGVPLTGNLVYIDGVLTDGPDLEIEFGDATKGKLVVTEKGGAWMGPA